MNPNPSARPPVVLAVDPGRSKCGIAVVSPNAVIHREIAPVRDLPQRVAALTAAHSPSFIVVGAGTGSAPVIASLSSQSSIPVEPVDESHTSEMARIRYLAENPPRGLRRLLPSFLRTPEEPYDDYVAIILAERRLKMEQNG